MLAKITVVPILLEYLCFCMWFPSWVPLKFVILFIFYAFIPAVSLSLFFPFQYLLTFIFWELALSPTLILFSFTALILLFWFFTTISVTFICLAWVGVGVRAVFGCWGAIPLLLVSFKALPFKPTFLSFFVIIFPPSLSLTFALSLLRLFPLVHV